MPTKITRFKNTDNGNEPLLIITPISINISQLKRNDKTDNPRFPFVIILETIIPDKAADNITVSMENSGITPVILLNNIAIMPNNIENDKTESRDIPAPIPSLLKAPRLLSL